MKKNPIKTIAVLMLTGIIVFDGSVNIVMASEAEPVIVENNTQIEAIDAQEKIEVTEESQEEAIAEDKESAEESQAEAIVEDEESVEESQTEDTEEDTKHSEENQTEETQDDSQAETEIIDEKGEPDETFQGEVAEGSENSWRYENGQRIFFDESINTYSDIPAWTEKDGYFYNNKGEKIEGAIRKGIDVSRWQGEIDWNRVKNTDIDYAIIRCGYGMNLESQDDEYWKRNADECTRLGIPFGTYLYSYADSIERAKSEAEHVLRLVAGYELDYPIYYDLEENSVRNNLSPYEIGQIAKTFCDTIEAAGYKVGIYSNTDWFTNYLTDSVFDTMNKWVAQYNSVCTYSGTYEMWQCTDAGYVDGISGNVDLNMDFGASNTPRVPDAVTNLKASSCGKNQVLISWNKSEGADGYLIYATKNGKYGYVGKTESCEYRDRRALENQNNFYWVFPYVQDRLGKMYVGETTNYVYAKGMNPVVQNIKASAYGKNKVKLTWNSISGVDGYLIYATKNGKYGYVGMTRANNSYIDMNALEQDYNYYWIFSYVTDSSGKMLPGEASKYVFAKGICAAVTGLKASSVQNGVKLTWNRVTDAEGYLIYGIVNGKKYSYVGMAKKGPGFIDYKASEKVYNYYWVFPYYTNNEGKMIVGETAQYTYGRAL